MSTITVTITRIVRTANFSQSKKCVLLDLVDKHREFVENKKTNACTRKVHTDH